MSNQNTIRMIDAYKQTASPTLFMSGFFQTRPRNIHMSEFVEIDITRNDEDIAIVISDLSLGPRFSEQSIYTNKRVTPPIFKEGVSLNGFDMINRMAGDNPFQDPDFRANLIMLMIDGMQESDKRIKRTIELQGSQILTTGTVDLIDSNGVTKYAINYLPKATHFPNAAAAWSGASDKIADISALCDVVRDDGLEDPDLLLMGIGSFEEFVSDTAVQARFDNRRINMGDIGPMQLRGKGGKFRGTIDVDNYKLEVWTYNGKYLNPNTGVKTKYLPDDKVVVMCSDCRLDATWGAVPHAGKALGQGNLLPELPPRFSMADMNMDMFTYVYLSEDGSQLNGVVAARPLLIPTAIDQFGCLDTLI